MRSVETTPMRPRKVVASPAKEYVSGIGLNSKITRGDLNYFGKLFIKLMKIITHPLTTTKNISELFTRVILVQILTEVSIITRRTIFTTSRVILRFLTV
jgi:hypothetical protein